MAANETSADAMQIRCPRCERVKPATDFFKSKSRPKGRQIYCIDCCRAWRKQYKESGREAAARKARMTEERRRAANERNRKYLASEKGKAYALRKNKREEQRHPEKVNARKQVKRAIEAGYIKRQPCEICGSTDRVHAHHNDYSKPLDVQWLCVPHHLEVHRAS